MTNARSNHLILFTHGRQTAERKAEHRAHPFDDPESAGEAARQRVLFSFLGLAGVHQLRGHVRAAAPRLSRIQRLALGGADAGRRTHLGHLRLEAGKEAARSNLCRRAARLRADVLPRVAHDRAGLPDDARRLGEIVPDEIYVHVELKEYEKKGQGKIDIESIRKNFLAMIRTMGLPEDAITVAGYGGDYGNVWWRKKNKNKDELYASVTYEVKLRKTSDIDKLVDQLDDESTSNFYIVRTSHSNMETFRKQLKFLAVKAAKEKAIYLARAVDDQIGEAVTINEPVEYYQPYFNTMSNARMKSEMDQGVADQQQADFKKIKIKFDVNVVFALQ